jgi:hypothetical protein
MIKADVEGCGIFASVGFDVDEVDAEADGGL